MILLLAVALVLVIVLGESLWLAQRENRRLGHRLEESAANLQNLQSAFSRFAPDEVIERVIANGISEFGEKKEVSVLFADLVGFTALSERVEPTDLVRILNGYFERMSDAITDRGGYVSTFIGDGLLAFFGALSPNPWQSNDATHAALAMRAALVDYNRDLVAEGLPTLALGVGLHRGTGVAGLVGSHELKEFAFVGRTVNVAARVQDLTRQFEVDILMTENVRADLDERFRLKELPPTSVKGVARPLLIYSVEGFDSE